MDRKNYRATRGGGFSGTSMRNRPAPATGKGERYHKDEKCQGPQDSFPRSPQRVPGRIVAIDHEALPAVHWGNATACAIGESVTRAGPRASDRLAAFCVLLQRRAHGAAIRGARRIPMGACPYAPNKGKAGPLRHRWGFQDGQSLSVLFDDAA
jgi:hypothetical protein